MWLDKESKGRRFTPLIDIDDTFLTRLLMYSIIDVSWILLRTVYRSLVTDSQILD